MLKFNQLTLNLSGQSIFRDLSFEVQEGELIFLRGKNGSGKTTLFDLITGTKKPDTGCILMHNQDIISQTEQERARWVSRLAQNTMQGCFPSLTVQENFILAAVKGQRARLHHCAQAYPLTRINHLIEGTQIEVKQLLNRPMNTLSGGQRQLLNFLMILLHEPKLLLLDEPTAALDPASVTLWINLAMRYLQTHRVTTILITHDDTLMNTMEGRPWMLK